MFFNLGGPATPDQAGQQGPSSAARQLSLSQREEEILVLSSQGLTDRQIAVELDIRPGTINTHWSRIRLKLGASTRSQAVAILLRAQAEEQSRQLRRERDSLLQQLEDKTQAQQRLGSIAKAASVALRELPIVLWVADESGAPLLLEGKAAGTLGAPGAAPDAQAQFVRALAKEEDFQRALEGRACSSEGAFEDRRFETHLAPWSDEEGRRGVVGLSIDATFAKAAQEALLASLKLLTSIVDASPSVIHVHDADEMREVFVNRRVFYTLGYSPKEIYDLGSNITMSLVHPDDVDRIQLAKQRVLELQDGEVLPVQYRMRRANGEYALVNDQVTVLSRHPDGRVKTVLGMAQVSHPAPAGPLP